VDGLVPPLNEPVTLQPRHHLIEGCGSVAHSELSGDSPNRATRLIPRAQDTQREELEVRDCRQSGRRGHNAGLYTIPIGRGAGKKGCPAGTAGHRPGCSGALRLISLTCRTRRPSRYNRIGSSRTRFPHAANTAFATAGATSGTGCSPYPLGASPLSRMIVSSCGMRSIRNT
jgi:hypothetical protein